MGTSDWDKNLLQYSQCRKIKFSVCESLILTIDTGKRTQKGGCLSQTSKPK